MVDPDRAARVHRRAEPGRRDLLGGRLRRSDCPDVKDIQGGLGILWTNQGRSLLVKVLPHPLVQFSMRSDSSDPMPLQTVACYDKLEETFFKLGRYVSGRKESECLGSA